MRATVETPRWLVFYVPGTPAPQGSKRHVGNGVMVESSKAVKPWRQDVTAAAIDAATTAGWETATGPVGLRLTFYLRRPRSHYGTGRNADQVKPSAPEYPATKPDLDKLQRSTLDALTTAGVLADDARVVLIDAAKVYATASMPTGARVEVRRYV